jgi:hypothetical protein
VKTIYLTSLGRLVSVAREGSFLLICALSPHDVLTATELDEVAAKHVRFAVVLRSLGEGLYAYERKCDA